MANNDIKKVRQINHHLSRVGCWHRADSNLWPPCGTKYNCTKKSLLKKGFLDHFDGQITDQLFLSENQPALCFLSSCLIDFPFPVALWHTTALSCTFEGKDQGRLKGLMLFIRNWNNTFIEHQNAKIHDCWRENHPFSEETRLKHKSRLKVNFTLKSWWCSAWTQTKISASILTGLNRAAQRSLSNLWAPVSISSPRPLCLWRADYKACFMLPGCVALRGNGH